MNIRINDKRIQTPDSWNQLTERDQLICYKIIMTDTGDLLTPEQLLPFKRIQLAMHLLGLEKDFMNEWQKDCIKAYGDKDGPMIFASELKEVLQTTDFLFSPVEGESDDQTTRYEINLALTNNPYPFLVFKKKNGKKKRLYGPDNELSNITLYELGITFTFFENYLKTKDIEFLHKLIGVMYRPPKSKTKKNKQSAYQGDIRHPFLDHEKMLAKRARRMAQLPETVKQMILFWFASCRQHIVNRHPNIFTSKGQSDSSNFGWAGVIMSLSGGLVNLKGISEQKQTNALTYLSYLEANRQEQALKNAKATPI